MERLIPSRIFNITLFCDLRYYSQNNYNLKRQTEQLHTMYLSPTLNMENQSPSKPISSQKAKEIKLIEPTQTKYTLNALQKLAQENSSSNSFMNMLLEDPALKEISDNLEKEAERKKKQLLLNNFPVRYKQLLLYETKYWELEIVFTEKIKEIERLNLAIKENKNIHRKDVERLSQELKERDTDISKRVTEFATLMNDRDQINKQLNEQIFTLNKTISHHDNTINNQKYDYQVGKDRIAQLEKEIKSITQQNEIIVSSLKEGKDSLKQELKSYEIKNCSLAGQLDSRETHVMTALREKQEEIVSLSKKLRFIEIQNKNNREQHEEQMTERHSEILMVKEKYLESVQQIQMMEDEINTLKDDIDLQTNLGSEDRTKYESDRHEWEIQSQFVRMLKQELEKLRIEHENSIRNHVEHNRELCGINKQLHEKVIDLQKAMNTIKLTNSNFERENQRVNDMFDKLQTQHEKSIENYGNSMTPLNEIITKLKVQLDQGIKTNILQSKKLINIEERLTECNAENSLLRQEVQKLDEEGRQLKEKKIESLQDRRTGVQAVLEEVEEHRQETSRKLAARQRQLRILKELVIQSKDLRQEIIPKIATGCENVDCQQAKSDNKGMHRTLDKMKKQMMELCENVQDKSTRERQLFEELLRENKMLRGLQRYKQ